MLWVKAFHVVFMVTWFAGLFYLPRLFVYHAMSEDHVSKERFKVMERKLYWGIMTPGALCTLFLGLWMLHGYAWQAYQHAGWFHAKLALVGLLAWYHLYCGHLVKVFAQDRNTRSHVWYRFFNEVPVLFLVVITILVIVKPF
jgi:putative membrane protein